MAFTPGTGAELKLLPREKVLEIFSYLNLAQQIILPLERVRAWVRYGRAKLWNNQQCRITNGYLWMQYFLQINLPIAQWIES